MQIQFPDLFTVNLKKAETSIDVDFAALPEASLRHIVEYGVRQILNDAMAAAKEADEAEGMARKRYDNLLAGTLRASPVREGNPIRKRAMELATSAVVKAPKFIKWAQDAGIKVTHKDAVKKAHELAAKAIELPDNKYMAQAAIDVAAAKELGVEDIDLDI